MKHLHAAARYSGLTLNSSQIRAFEVYSDWLRDEGVRAGGLGPDETERLERRHLADSLLFASLIPDGAGRVWDLGTGVGLPGIPLAITLPEIEFRLIDRSGRRIDLLRRVVRILDLPNCEVLQGEINELNGKVGTIVARASLPPADLSRIAMAHLKLNGAMIAGGSWQRRPCHVGWETIEIPADVLDQTVWLLMMRRA